MWTTAKAAMLLIQLYITCQRCSYTSCGGLWDQIYANKREKISRGRQFQNKPKPVPSAFSA